MAEEQAQHRRSLEGVSIVGNMTAQTRGQWMGFIIVMFAIGVGAYLIYLGKDASGIATIITALSSLVAVFIAGRILQTVERKDRRSDLLAPGGQQKDSVAEND